MNQFDAEPDVAEALDTLLKTIYTLTREKRNEWVTWKEVARRQEGSELLSTHLSGYARLPQAQGLFVQDNGGRLVKLTPDGQRRAATAQVAAETETEEVARAVKQYASRLWPQRLNIEYVQPVAKVGGRYVEAVGVNLDDSVIPSETPVTFRPEDGAGVRGRLVGQEVDGSTLYVAFDSEVRTFQLPGVLLVDRAYLLHQLAEAIGELRDRPPLSAPLWEPLKDRLTIAHENSAAVARMLAALRAPWSRYLWGPPGSGKTYALGRLALSLAQKSSHGRILLVAPSNLAVDVAVEEFVTQAESDGLGGWLDERRILRYGYPRKASILEREELLGPPEQAILSQQISQLSRKLRQAEREEAPAAELATFRAELLSVQEELRTLVRDHIKGCALVATTTTLAYMQSSPIHEIAWDTVLVDEVTMVPSAVFLYLSHLAGQRLLLAGDPRQLGPVYEESGRATEDDLNWMGRDVFDLSGISTGDGASRQVRLDDRRLARIISQRRCGRGIWAQVEHLYPEVAVNVDEVRLQRLRDLPPDRGQSLTILDVGQEKDAVCDKVHQSWQNHRSAEMALEAARTMVREADGSEMSIAIIAPYRAQVKLLRRRLSEERKAETLPAGVVETGTIHEFQGSEADVVIFDMVDGPRRRGPGKLLRGDTGIRLVNVAVTRARGKVVLLANRAWCRRSLQREDNPLLYDLIFNKKAPPVVESRKQPFTSAAADQPETDRDEPSSIEVVILSEDVPDARPTRRPAIERGDVDEELLSGLPRDIVIEIADRAAKSALNKTLFAQGFRDSKRAAFTDWSKGETTYRIHHKKSAMCEFSYGIERL